MTPEEEQALMKQLKAMQNKLDSYEKKANDETNAKLDSKRKELAELTGEKVEVFAEWDDKALDSSLTVMKKNQPKVEENVPTEDQLVPKFDSNKNEIPWAMRINWSKASYPKWE